MRVLIAVLVLIFSLQSWTKADDPSEFEIEGMSIGDSLLNYFSQEEIIKNMKWEYNIDRKNNNFVTVEFYDLVSANTYHGIQVIIKPNDKNYKVYAISGVMPYKKNIEACYLKMNDIAEEISNIFQSARKQKTMKSENKSDKSGKSTFSGIYFYFKDGGNASVQCYDYSDDYTAKNGPIDNLRISIRSNEYREWYRSSRK